MVQPGIVDVPGTTYTRLYVIQYNLYLLLPNPVCLRLDLRRDEERLRLSLGRSPGELSAMSVLFFDNCLYDQTRTSVCAVTKAMCVLHRQQVRPTLSSAAAADIGRVGRFTGVPPSYI